MNRRDALKSTVLLVGGAVVAGSGLLAGCVPGEQSASVAPGSLERSDQDLLEEIADTLLPSTPTSPGAKAAGVGPVIAMLLDDCRPPADLQRITRGMAELRTRCRSKYAATFASLPRARREEFLRLVDADAQRAGPSHWYFLARELANTAYFSTEIGLTKALRYVRVPGHWTGCMPLQPGQPAWG